MEAGPGFRHLPPQPRASSDAVGRPAPPPGSPRGRQALGLNCSCSVTLAGALNSLSRTPIPGPLERLPSGCPIPCLALG